MRRNPTNCKGEVSGFCGINEHGVVSLVDLGVLATMDEADAALKAGFERVFGAVALAPQGPYSIPLIPAKAGTQFCY